MLRVVVKEDSVAVVDALAEDDDNDDDASRDLKPSQYSAPSTIMHVT
jgi:hypothetical protein